MEPDGLVEGMLGGTRVGCDGDPKEAFTQGHPGESDPIKGGSVLASQPPSGAGWITWVLLSIGFLILATAIIGELLHKKSLPQPPQIMSVVTNTTPPITPIFPYPSILDNPELDMQIHYATYNARFFDNRLPPAMIVCESRISLASGTLGSTWWSGKGHLILISKEVCDIDQKVYLPILLHEMVHVDIGESHVGENSRLYENDMKRILRAGALDDIMIGDHRYKEKQ